MLTSIYYIPLPESL